MLKPMNGREPGGFKGRLNIYVCRVCRNHVVTRDEDNGVTPFLIGCAATPGCAGTMQSSMYRVFDQSMDPDLIWRKPTDEEIETATPGEKAHYKDGGLKIAKPGE